MKYNKNIENILKPPKIKVVGIFPPTSKKT